MNKIFLAGALLLAFIVTGCTPAIYKDITVDAEAGPKANLAGYKSYTWLGSAAILQDSLGQWEPPQFDADAEIEFLIERELRKRGMSRNSVSPDLVVAYAAGIDMDVLRLKVDPESKIETLENVPEGALTVILVDAETGVPVWAGLATAEVQQNNDMELVKKRLDYAVSKMFDKFPN